MVNLYHLNTVAIPHQIHGLLPNLGRFGSPISVYALASSISFVEVTLNNTTPNGTVYMDVYFLYYLTPESMSPDEHTTNIQTPCKSRTRSKPRVHPSIAVDKFGARECLLGELRYFIESGPIYVTNPNYPQSLCLFISLLPIILS